MCKSVLEQFLKHLQPSPGFSAPSSLLPLCSSLPQGQAHVSLGRMVILGRGFSPFDYLMQQTFPFLTNTVFRVGHFLNANQIKIYHDEILISKKLLVACVTQGPLVSQFKGWKQSWEMYFSPGSSREMIWKSSFQQHYLYSDQETLLFHSKFFLLLSMKSCIGKASLYCRGLI